MHRVKVKVVEGALDANETIAAANRADFDRAGVTVVNLMSAPGAGKTTLLGGPCTSGWRAPGRARGRCRGSFDADRLSRFQSLWPRSTPAPASAASATWTRTWSARRCRVPLADLDLLIIENVGNLVCPAEFHVGEDARG